MKRLMWVVPAILLLTCYGCNQSTTENVIQDGAEAATVAAVIALDTALPNLAGPITNGLQKASGEALKLLSFPSDMFTLEQLIRLDMANGDPYLDKYQAIINFALPILNDIPGIDKALNTPLNGLSSNMLNDVRAFFTGIQLALGQPSGTTVESLMACNPRLRKTVRKYGTGRFDINGLINALKTDSKPHSSLVPAPVFESRGACASGHCHAVVLTQAFDAPEHWEEDAYGVGHYTK